MIAAGNTVQGAAGETTSLAYNDLVNTMQLVDPAYADQPTSGFMFAYSTLKAVRLLKDTSGRPVGKPALRLALASGFLKRFSIALIS